MANALLCAIASVILVISPLSINDKGLAGHNTDHTQNSQSSSEIGKTALSSQSNCPDNQTANGNNKAVENGSDNGWWGGIVNTFLALATAVIAIFSVIQGRATQRSAEALIASERAWLVAELVPTAMLINGKRMVPAHGYTGELTEDDMADIQEFEYSLKVKNVGKTPAFVTKYTINRSDGVDDGELIDFDLPSRHLGAGEHWYPKALNVPEEVRKYPAGSRVFFFGHVFYRHVFSKTETVKDGFSCLFQRKTGQLMRIPLEENAKNQS